MKSNDFTTTGNVNYNFGIGAWSNIFTQNPLFVDAADIAEPNGIHLSNIRDNGIVLKITLVTLLFICLHSLKAQDNQVTKEILAIDSLLVYVQLDLAHKKADSLYRLLSAEQYADGSAERLEQVLTVRLQEGIALDELSEHSKALPIFMEVLKIAEKNKFHKLICRTYIRISLNHEKTRNFDVAFDYLNSALKVCQKHQLEEQYSTILIRSASLQRLISRDVYVAPEQRERLQELGFKGSIDSAIYCAEKAVEYAQKYNNEGDLNTAYYLLGILVEPNNQNKTEISTEYHLKVIPYFKKIKDYKAVAMRYANIAAIYLRDNDAKTALCYNDSGYVYYDKLPEYYKLYLPQQRAQIFEALQNADSAYYYLQIAHDFGINYYEKQEAVNAKKLEEQYQNDKKETMIKNKNNQIALISILFSVIVIVSLLLMFKNRKIDSQKNIISEQVMDLTKMLEQKEVLLSELQHRVKNNLQFVISILEIQKESVSFNNIDELIRGNQNRIHSMALLHKKLSVSNNINDVNFKNYLTDLAELVKNSYTDMQKKIEVDIICEVETVSINKTLPIGLIIVELLSNSIKHAFKKQDTGIINIHVTKDEATQMNKLIYADNGDGFDFSITPESGLGLEIIKGLIDQLDATIETQQHKGFKLTINFK